MKKFALLLLIGIPVLLGCGGGTKFKTETQLVEGVIEMDGSPIANATITLIPKGEGELASGFSNDQGKFTVNSLYGAPGQGAMAGEYGVTVSQVEVSTIPSKSGDPTEAKTVSKELLPAIYQDKEKTPLSVAIQKGKNSIKLELTKKP